MSTTTPDRYQVIDTALDVQARLKHLKIWHADYQQQMAQLENRIDHLRQVYLTEKTSSGKHRAIQQTSHLAIYRKRFQLLQVQKPLTLAFEQRDTFQNLLNHLLPQYLAFSQVEKQLWLNNLIFLMTPDVRQLCAKLDALQAFQTSGQERNLLVSGASGSGKSSALHWYTLCHMPIVQAQRTHIPVVMVEPLEDDQSRKSLLEQIILSCGDTYVGQARPLELLNQVNACFAWCQTQLLIVDELNHLTTNKQRRQLLSITNKCGGVSIVGSAVYPQRFRNEDDELAGRFLDEFPMHTYTGKPLIALLAFIDLLLPFSTCSGLSQTSTVAFIEGETRGRLREIMLLIRLASEQALLHHEACLTLASLRTTWANIQRSTPHGN